MEVKLIKSIYVNDTSSEFTDSNNVKLIHEKNITGQGVKVAILDTGCEMNHPLLNLVTKYGKNFTNEGNEDVIYDFNGHGTHVAGIIAGSHVNGVYGIAPNVELLICKVLNKEGVGYCEWICNAIEYAIDQSVDIINMSLGMKIDDVNLHEVIKKAIDKGILVVCASGNSGDGQANTDECDYPGCYEEVICVGAVDNQCNVSIFSNSNKYVDLVAPGENITSTYLDSSIKVMTGTSMSTPYVTGCLALIKEWSTKEFGRKLSEIELYGELIKNTKTLNCERTLQGHGMLVLECD